jgi:hypothetical protein
MYNTIIHNIIRIEASVIYNTIIHNNTNVEAASVMCNLIIHNSNNIEAASVKESSYTTSVILKAASSQESY